MPEPPMMPSTALVIAFLRRTKTKGPEPGPDVRSWRAALHRGGARILAVRDLARLFDFVPDLLLGEIEKNRQHEQEDQYLKAEPLARLERGFRHPHQERGHVP